MLLAVSMLLAGAAARAEAPHPALWKVAGKHCVVYLFGSVHILSPDLRWRDARVGRAIDAADAFYFETALDPKVVQQLIVTKGSLPPGQSLRALLPPASQKDLDDDFATLDIGEAPFDMRRPWLVELVMVGRKAMAAGGPPTGVDLQVMADAKARGKPLRYFETIDQQVALLAPDDPKVELDAFEMFLKSFRAGDLQIGPIVDAWDAGDEPLLAKRVFADFDKHPDERKALFDDRNKAWTKTLESVLASESGTFFVTVGAGHLLTPRGVPALLAQDGYKVERL